MQKKPFPLRTLTALVLAAVSGGAFAQATTTNLDNTTTSTTTQLERPLEQAAFITSGSDFLQLSNPYVMVSGQTTTVPGTGQEPSYIQTKNVTYLDFNGINITKQGSTYTTSGSSILPLTTIFSLLAAPDGTGAVAMGTLDLSRATVTGLFDPAKVTATLTGGTTANDSFTASGYSVDLVTGAAALGATTTNGITNTGDISTTTLTTTGNATVGGALAVTGATSTNGITNTGDISTTTLTTTGNATVGGALAVTGATSTNGITNTGAIRNTGSIFNSGDFLNGGNMGVLGTTVLRGATTVQSTLDVTGATTLNGATTVNNTLNVNGATTVVGATSITGTTSIHGATTVVGTTNINTTGTAATTIGNAAAAATLVGNVVSASAGNGGNSGLTLKNGEASMTVTNSLGNTHGLVVGESSTTLSGGTRSTNLTLNDNGATFSNAATGAPTRVTGVANGAGDFDAVNVRQFSSAVAGATATANIPGVDTNKTASVGVGMGSYMNSQALAFGGSYRFSDKGVLRASLATGLNTGGSKTSFGIGAGWSW